MVDQLCGGDFVNIRLLCARQRKAHATQAKAGKLMAMKIKILHITAPLFLEFFKMLLLFVGQPIAFDRFLNGFVMRPFGQRTRFKKL